MDEAQGTAPGRGRQAEMGSGQEASPARQFGFEMASDPRFAGRRWVEVEQELRAVYPDWVRSHGHAGSETVGWDSVKSAVREAWESALDVEQLGMKPSTGQWDQLAPEYRRLWEERRLTDETWEEVEPGYRYASEMAFDPRYQGRPWGDVAPFLEAGLPAWAATHGYQLREGDGLWQRLRDSIRHTWERITHRSAR